MYCRFGRIVSLASGLTMVACGSAFGEKWVDAHAAAGGNGTKDAPYRTIQEAFAAASANETIWVKPRTTRTAQASSRSR